MPRVVRPPLERARRRRTIAFVVAGLCMVSSVGNLTDTFYAAAVTGVVLAVAALVWAAVESKTMRDVQAAEVIARADAAYRNHG